MKISDIESLRCKLQHSCDLLIQKVGPIQIGTPEQFPFGWKKAAKGRTVWRIVEEIITQNLEKYHKDLNIDSVHASDSEVSVYDMKCTFGTEDVYINIKSAVAGGKRQKDDISKAVGLTEFYKEDPSKHFFVATFFIRFNANMSIEITKVIVFPIVWIPDVYINPSNNGNLQSAYYKDLLKAKHRTNQEFLPLLHEAFAVAKEKRKKKNK